MMGHYYSRLLILTLLILLKCYSSTAQSTNPGESDSLRFYKEVERYSKKNRLTRLLYRSVLKPVTPAATKKNKNALKLKLPNLDLYNCRIIRNISIDVEDPFGYTILDTIKEPEGLIPVTGNKLHVKTRRFAVLNFLLFRSGQEYDAFRVSESERLLRQSGLFRDVIIYPVPLSNSKDSVDIIVRCIDRWSFYFKVDASTSSAKFRVTDKNVVGTGHSLMSRTNFDRNGFTGYSLQYDINRIKTSYITVKLLHEEFNSVSRSTAFSVSRPFYSPLTKWSYGAVVYDYKYPELLFYTDSFYIVPKLISRGYDVYVSNSHRLKQNGTSFEKNVSFTNLILSARTIKVNQDASGLESVDIFNIYHSINYYMGMVAISNVKFRQENYIMKFGEIEDIPLGFFAGIITGFDPLRYSNYTGLRLAFSEYQKLRYFSLIGNYGLFNEPDGTSRSILNLRLTMFSPLFTIGDWKFRQFIRGNYLSGVNMLPNRYLLLSNVTGLESLSSLALVGYRRIVMGIQTQAYAPFQILGFRFGPVVYAAGGMIANKQSDLFKGKLYSSLGLGLLIRNDFLINSTFQVSISIFPNLFGTTEWYRLNDVKSSDFELPAIQQDKPEFVSFY